MMRIFSLWQPWATFCVVPDPARGHPPKQWETRHWPLLLPLPVQDVAIHATKRIDRRLLRDVPIVEQLVRRLGPIVFERGAIIGVVDIVDHQPTDNLSPPEIDELEMALGNYSSDRFAFRLANVRPLRVPIRLKGRQSVLWEAPPELEALVRAQL